jgi:hypothetical protein
MHTEGNDPGRPEGTSPKPSFQRSEDQPGYETQDVNIGGVLVFLAGLSGFLLIFFVFCFGMGKVINIGLEKQDGPADRWHPWEAKTSQKRQDMTSDPQLEQQVLRQVVNTFPTPRLDIDDGNQATADLHAREDLLLEHYSTVDGQPGTVRIPIERAMQLIAERGLPVTQAGAPAELTDGFARTGYELDTIEAREQKLSYSRAEGEPHGSAPPSKQ